VVGLSLHHKEVKKDRGCSRSHLVSRVNSSRHRLGRVVQVVALNTRVLWEDINLACHNFYNLGRKEVTSSPGNSLIRFKVSLNSLDRKISSRISSLGLGVIYFLPKDLPYSLCKICKGEDHSNLVNRVHNNRLRLDKAVKVMAHNTRLHNSNSPR
jgi:hypothetical protein